MAPPRKHRKAEVRDDQASADSDGNDGSPHVRKHKPTNHIQTAQAMLDASRRRREAKRKAIETEHAHRVGEAGAKIQAFYEDRQNKIAKVQAAQWDQLAALLKTRRSIEKVIIGHLKTIEQRTFNLSTELDAVYEGRLEEIAEMNTTGKSATTVTEKI